jgi:hypothetical protein
MRKCRLARAFRSAFVHSCIRAFVHFV